MVVLAERRSSRSALWAARLATFSAVLFVVAGLGHRFGLVETIGFFWVLGSVAALALAALVLAGRLLPAMDLRRAGRPALRARSSSALLVLSPFLVSAWRVYAFPTLSDISTDVTDPPPLDAAALLRTGDMNPVAPISADNAALQADAYPDVTGRRYPLSADRVQELAAALVSSNGWTFTAPPSPPMGGSDGMIEALAKTTILAFPVDISIRVTDEGETSYVDMRSASRYGRHDLGDNAARIAGFLDGARRSGCRRSRSRSAEPTLPASDVPVPTEPPAQSDAPPD